MGRKRSVIRSISGVAIAAALAVLALPPDSGVAQTAGQPSALTQTLQNLLSNGSAITPQTGTSQTINPSVTTQQTIIAPSVQQAASQAAYYNQPQTRLEQIMSQRAGMPLYQFGYNLLGTGQAVVSTQVGQVQDDYILGPGDLIDIAMRGQNTSEYRVTVDRDGRVIIPGVAPVAASGRRFGDFRNDLINGIHHAFVATDAYVSVAQVRQVSVVVSGAVNNPGVRNLTALSTPLDAILVSGGVQKIGSLRNIRIVRGGRTLSYDLYDFITQRGNMGRITLADGDRIIVPPLGATVAVTGWVRVPGIYELPAGASGLAARSLISLAGGLEVRGRYRLVVMRVSKDGRREIVELPGENSVIRDSEVLFAQPAVNDVVGGTTLSGGQSLAGTYSISRAQRLSGLLKAPGSMGDQPYALFGVVVRRDQNTYVKSLVAFAPSSVLEGVDDISLASNDVVRVFSTAEAAMLLKTTQDYQNQQQAVSQYDQNPQLSSQTAPMSTLPQTGNNGGGNQNQANASAQAGLLSGGNGGASQLPVQQFTPGQPFPPTQNPVNPSAIQPAAGPGNMPTPQSVANNQQTQTAQQYQQLLALQQQQGQYLPQQQYPAMPGQTPLNPTPSPATAQQPTIVGGINLDQEVVQNPPAIPANSSVQNFTQVAVQLGVDPQVLINFLIDNQVRIDGAVRGPGVYLVGPHVNLKDLVSVAGGTNNWADESGVELLSTRLDPASGRADTQRQVLPLREASLQNYQVQPHDQIRFNQLYSTATNGTITLTGEVRSPGTYPIMKGERLSQVLVRAGGLTEVAYPYGTVFLRPSAAALEEIGFQKAADEVQKQFLVGMSYAASSGSNSGSATNLVALGQFVQQLRTMKPLGRISIQADPSVLAAHPDQDPLLEPGDYILIPQRTNTITVLGDVNQPGTFAFDSDKNPKDYIEMAGGYGTYADGGWTYVVYPDGTAQELDSSWFQFDRKQLPPGSVIWVPRNLLPINWANLAVSMADILKDFALGGAALVAISNANVHCGTNLKSCR